MMQDFQSDFDQMPLEPGFEMNAFDAFDGMDDLGDDFGGGWDF